MHFAQRALGNVDRRVVAPAGHGPVGAKVLGRRGHRLGGSKIGALEAADFRARNLHGEPRIFARTFHRSAPAKIARDIQHRRERHREAVCRRLPSGFACRELPDVRIERRGFRERHGEKRAVTVDHVEPDQERNAEPRFLDGDSLHVVNVLCADEVEQVAERAVADGVGGIAGDDGPGHRVARRGHGELAQLLRQGHATHQLVNCAHGDNHDLISGKIAGA